MITEDSDLAKHDIIDILSRQRRENECYKKGLCIGVVSWEVAETLAYFAGDTVDGRLDISPLGNSSLHHPALLLLEDLQRSCLENHGAM